MTDDVIGLTRKVHEKIIAMERKREDLSALIETKKRYMYSYFKNKTVAVMKLKNKEPVELAGKPLRKNYSDSMIPMFADLIVSDDKVCLEISTLEYNAAVAGLRSLQAELNGYQTMLRYLDE